MRNFPAFVGCIALLAGAGVAAADETDVAAFVHRIGPVSYEVASKFGDKDVDTLVGMLKDKNERMWWTNIATALGYAGNPRAVDPLIEFVKGDANLPNDPRQQRQVIDARKAA